MRKRWICSWSGKRQNEWTCYSYSCSGTLASTRCLCWHCTNTWQKFTGWCWKHRKKQTGVEEHMECSGWWSSFFSISLFLGKEKTVAIIFYAEPGENQWKSWHHSINIVTTLAKHHFKSNRHMDESKCIDHKGLIYSSATSLLEIFSHHFNTSVLYFLHL